MIAFFPWELAAKDPRTKRVPQHPLFSTELLESLEHSRFVWVSPSWRPLDCLPCNVICIFIERYWVLWSWGCALHLLDAWFQTSYALSWNDVKRAHDRNAPWDAPCFQFVSSWNQSTGSRFVWEMSSPQFAWQQLLVTKQPWNMFWHIELQLPSKASRVNCHAALLQCRDFVSTLFREADFWISVILWCRTTTRTPLGLCRILLYTQV